jgi:hypothetical protein
MTALDAFGGRANAIAWFTRWLDATQTTRPLPVARERLTGRRNLE